jgi:hypothetical protein
MAYKASAAYPYIERERAVAARRGHLRTLADRDGALSDWSTLRIAGPTEVIGEPGRVWHEWSASIDAQPEHARYL